MEMEKYRGEGEREHEYISGPNKENIPSSQVLSFSLPNQQAGVLNRDDPRHAPYSISPHHLDVENLDTTSAVSITLISR